MRRDPQGMTYPEIIGEIQMIRANIQKEGLRVYELTRILQDRVRKQGADEYTSRYVAFANANTRFIGGMEQGLQRVASFDRLVGTIQKERKEAEERDEREKDRPKKRDYTSPTSPLADLTELFGQEMIDDAAR